MWEETKVSKDEPFNRLNKGKKTVNFSGVSYHSESSQTAPSKANLVFDEKFMSLVSKNKIKLRNKETYEPLDDKSDHINFNTNEDVEILPNEDDDISDTQGKISLSIYLFSQVAMLNIMSIVYYRFFFFS